MMGVLVKRPGDKLKSNPIKLWGTIAILSFFASFVFSYVGGKTSDASAKATRLPGSDFVQAATGEVGTMPKLKYENANCPEVDPESDEAGLVAVCGRVVSTYIEWRDSKKYLDVQRPVVGATVAIYENDRGTNTGKTKAGELSKLFSSTVTDKYGFFRIKMRGLGPGNLSVYLVALCDSDFSKGKPIEDVEVWYNGDWIRRFYNLSYVGGRRLKSLRHISTLPNIEVNCDPNHAHTYEVPPPKLAIVERGAIMECTTDVLAQGQGENDTFTLIPVKHESPSRVRQEDNIKEENYDFRYVSRDLATTALFSSEDADTSSATGLVALADKIAQSFIPKMFEETEGSHWAPDCLIKNPDAQWVCSSEAMDAYYKLGEGGYLMNTALKFIPEQPELLAWRRLDNRATFRQFNQYPFAAVQYNATVFGDYVGKNLFIKQAESKEEQANQEWMDPLVSCESIAAGSSTMGRNNRDNPRVFNKSTTTSWGIGLSSPYLWDDILKFAYGEKIMDDMYCKEESSGTIYTAGEIMASKKLRDKYFRPELVFGRGSGSLPHNTQTANDSAYQENDTRGAIYDLFESESKLHARDQAGAIIPEYLNGQGSTARPLVFTGVLGEENILTNLVSPYVYKEETEVDSEGKPIVKIKITSLADRPIKTWDLGSYITGYCSVGNTWGPLEEYSISRFWDVTQRASRNNTPVINHLHNFFGGNADHILDSNVGSGTYYTADTKIRDELLKEPGNRIKGSEEFNQEGPLTPLGGSTAWRETFDSLLEMAAGEDRIALDTLTAADVVGAAINSVAPDGLTKSFGDRGEFETLLLPRKVTYPLNAENFPDIFVGYGQPGYGDADEEFYPWGDVGFGNFCDVHPGRGNPDIEGKEAQDGLPALEPMRTCRLNRDEYCNEEADVCMTEYCRVYRHGWYEICKTDANRNKYDCYLEYQKHDRNCNDGDEKACLIGQEDERDKRWRDFLKENPLRWGGERPEERRDTYCALERAGPYGYIAPYEAAIDIDIVQNEARDGYNATPMDTLLTSVTNFKQQFGSPGEIVEEARWAAIDENHSKASEDVEMYHFDTTGYGAAPSGIHQIGASPSTPSAKPTYGPMYFHCDVDPPEVMMGGKPVWPWMSKPGQPYYWKCVVEPFVMGECDTEAFKGVLKDNPYGEPIKEAVDYFDLYILEKFGGDDGATLMEAYGFASANTGIPCEILAGIHHMEGGNKVGSSLEDGHPINPGDLPADALDVAQRLAKNLSKAVSEWDFKDYVHAINIRTGGGNRNCLHPLTPWGISHTPEPCSSSLPFYAWDDSYPMSLMTHEHKGMFVRFCYDNVLCIEIKDLQPEEFVVDGWLMETRPGVLPVSMILNGYLTGER